MNRTVPSSLHRIVVRALASAAAAFCALTACADGASAAIDLSKLGPNAGDRLVTARLAVETQRVAPGTTATLGLELTPAPGWHIYWRNPGEAGLPPQATWTLPRGASVGDTSWPVPERLMTGQIESNVYTKPATLLIPLHLAAATPLGAARVGAALKWLVCSTVCIPGKGSVATAIDVVTHTDPTATEDPAFARARAAIPKPAPFATEVDAGASAVTLSWPLGSIPMRHVATVAFFADPSGAAALAPSAAQRYEVRGGRGTLRLARAAPPVPTGPIPGVLTLTGTDASGARAELAYTIVPGSGTAADGSRSDRASGSGNASGPLAALVAIALAFAGGLLLNLMPCVFPVLAFKAMGVIREAPGRRWANAISYAVGVVACCSALGGALLLARAGGAALGWGFQLQSPLFVAGLASVVFFLALSMSGTVELVVPVPAMLRNRFGAGTPAASFFDGALVAIIASACTAPYMGAALGYALTAPAAVAIGIFAALGFGIALPYALVAGVPGIAARVPKPGAWTLVARQLLAFPLFATVAWLVWVFAQQAGSVGLLGLLAALVLVAFGTWALGSRDLLGAAWRRSAVALAGASLAGAIAIVVATTHARASLAAVGASPAGSAGVAGAASTTKAFEPFAPARLASLRAAGRPVLVDMSAAWCITCQVNEAVALDRPEVVHRLAALNAVEMRGDWTNGDPQITAFLQRFGRSGVPLYVYYAADGSAHVLPQLLTPAIVLSSLATPAS